MKLGGPDFIPLASVKPSIHGQKRVNLKGYMESVSLLLPGIVKPLITLVVRIRADQELKARILYVIMGGKRKVIITARIDNAHPNTLTLSYTWVETSCPPD